MLQINIHHLCALLAIEVITNYVYNLVCTHARMHVCTAEVSIWMLLGSSSRLVLREGYVCLLERVTKGDLVCGTTSPGDALSTLYLTCSC